MKKFDKSIVAFEEAQDLMPGGVNSRFVPLSLLG